jgi:hypothetical protein
MDDILKLLEDGKWHDMKEVTDNSRLHDLKVEMIMNFLSEYDFVELDKKRQKAKLTSSLCKFVRKIKIIEEKEAVKELEVP